MKLLKINNLKDMFGQPDYKGLDIEQFVGGGQVYPSDLSYCLVATKQTDFEPHTDIVELTENEYRAEKQTIVDAQKAKVQTTEEKIELLQKAVDDMLLGGAL